MEFTENQDKRSSRDILMERMSQRFPEKTWKGQTGNDGQEGQDDLEQAILDTFDQQEGIIADNNSKNAAMLDLFTSDPSAASFINKWIEYGDPRRALVEEFGDDLSKLSTEEGRGQFVDELSGWRERKAESDRLNQEADAAWDASLQALNTWGDEKGLDNNQKAQIIARLITIAADGYRNIYKPEDFDMVYKETNFDKAVADARNEGIITGRNERINAQRRERTSAAAMPPTLPGGQGMRVNVEAPEKPYNPMDEVE